MCPKTEKMDPQSNSQETSQSTALLNRAKVRFPAPKNMGWFQDVNPEIGR